MDSLYVKESVSFFLSVLHSVANPLPALWGESEHQTALCVLQEEEFIFG